MENEKKKVTVEAFESLDLIFDGDLKSAYKPMDELFDTLIDDDGYQDLFPG